MRVLVIVCLLAAPARAEHRRFVFGVGMGVGADVGEQEAGLGLAFRIGYRPVAKLAVLWTADLSIVDLDPEGTVSAHALVAQVELGPKAFVLIGPALGFVNPPSGESVTGGGALAALGLRIAPFDEYDFLRGDVELELRGHAAFRDGESLAAALVLLGVGF